MLVKNASKSEILAFSVTNILPFSSSQILQKRISGHFCIQKSPRYMKNPRDVQAQAKHSSNARFLHENPVTWETNRQTYQKTILKR